MYLYGKETKFAYMRFMCYLLCALFPDTLLFVGEIKRISLVVLR